MTGSGDSADVEGVVEMVAEYSGHNWEDANVFLAEGKTASSRDHRRIGNNTVLHRLEDGRIAVQLHDTDVILYSEDGSVVLESGGWLTVTTKDRMNRYGPKGWTVYSERGVWFVNHYPSGWERSKAERFFDGISTMGDRVVNPLPEDEVRKQDARRREILKDISGYVVKVREAYDQGWGKDPLEDRPVPDGGDCWFCYFGNEDGSMGDLGGNTSHLEDHIAEGYVVPSLVARALREKGYQAVAYMILDPESIGRAVRSYLKTRLLPKDSGSSPKMREGVDA